MSKFFIVDLYPEDIAKIETEFKRLNDIEKFEQSDGKIKYAFVMQAIFNGYKIEKVGGRFILGDTARKMAELSYNYCQSEEE